MESAGKVYIRMERGRELRNFSTGTKLYQRKCNALNKCSRESQTVVEYDLVPTGKVYNYKGEEV